MPHSHQPQEDKWQEPETKYAPRKQRPKKGRKRESERKETKEQLTALPIKPAARKGVAEPAPFVVKSEPKTSRKGEPKLSALPVKPATRKVAAEQIPLSQETSAAALKKRTLLPASVPSQPTGTLGRSMQCIISLVTLLTFVSIYTGEALQRPEVAYKHEDPRGPVIPTKYYQSAVVCK